MKLLSLNIEKREHLVRVKGFIEREKAEVIAMMEVCKDNLDQLLVDYPYRIFGANFRLRADGVAVGVVIAAQIPLDTAEVWYADGNSSENIPVEALGIHRPVVVSARIGGMRLAATHFTWTPNMSETDKQHEDLGRLLSRFSQQDGVLCGDFNIPRGNGAYARLTEHYNDYVPKDVTTTIDFDLHRAKREGKPRFEAVVDYIFATNLHHASDVQVACGVSDHCGLVATITSS